MAFELNDRWVWDFWIAKERGDYHLFFLQAPRSLDDPDLRHRNATVGHAVSGDLVNWTELGVALEPGEAGEWDDLATWTGSVIRAGDRWWMFYTGASHGDDGLVQRIGAAYSEDLATWTKHPHNPLLETDDRWYETLDLDAWHDQAWRDPWVHQVDGGYEMLITARARSGPAFSRGVIGRATSADLVSWTVGLPLTRPAGFGHMEVPQRASINERDVLLFSCGRDQLSSDRRAISGPDDRCYFLELNGSVPCDASGAVALDTPNIYSARAVKNREGQWMVLGFELDDGRDGFAGRISDPIPLKQAAPALFDSVGRHLAEPV